MDGHVEAVDGDHSNAHAEWERQGRPDDPAPAQLARLHESGRLALLATPTRETLGPGRSLYLEFSLPMFGLSLLEITPADSGSGPQACSWPSSGPHEAERASEGSW